MGVKEGGEDANHGPNEEIFMPSSRLDPSTPPERPDPSSPPRRDDTPSARRAEPRAAAAAALLFLGVLAAGGCAETSTGPGDGTPPAIDQLPRALTGAEQELIASTGDFGFRLLSELRAEEREAGDGPTNVFVSPLSASMVLGMAMNGARGTTREGMKEALGIEELTLEEANRSYRDLIELLRGLDPRVEFLLGNSVWLREGFPVRPAFTDDVGEFFDAETFEVDFSDPATADSINRWVESSTDGEIRRLVTPQSVSGLVALLANAVYFQGDWREPFDPDETRDGTFRRPDGSTVQVPLMHNRDIDGARFARTEDFVAADLPYGGSAFSMTVVLPPEGVAVDSLVRALGDRGAEGWREIVARLEPGPQEVVLPRFELAYEKLFNDALRALGMVDAFDPMRADFGPMVEGDRTDGLFLDWVKQKSVVKVDEQGTEAAAATGAGVSSLPFRADRPFLVAIRERLSGTVLFVGAVVDPTAG